MTLMQTQRMAPDPFSAFALVTIDKDKLNIYVNADENVMRERTIKRKQCKNTGVSKILFIPSLHLWSFGSEKPTQIQHKAVYMVEIINSIMLERCSFCVIPAVR